MTEQLPWKNYEGESASQLFEMRDRWRADSLVTAFFEALSRHKPSGRWPERVVLAVEEFEGRVNGEGLEAFLSENPEYVNDIVPALREIGCGHLADVVQRGIDRLPAERTEELDDDALEDLDEEIYASYPDVAGQLLTYIGVHLDEIRIGTDANRE